MDKTLFIGQRYTFYIKNKDIYRNIRANLKNIYYHNEYITIILDNADSEKDKTTIISIPFDMIIKVENLISMIDDAILPSDILLLIDNYF